MVQGRHACASPHYHTTIRLMYEGLEEGHVHDTPSSWTTALTRSARTLMRSMWVVRRFAGKCNDDDIRRLRCWRIHHASEGTTAHMHGRPLSPVGCCGVTDEAVEMSRPTANPTDPTGPTPGRPT